MQHCGGADHGRPPPLVSHELLDGKHKSNSLGGTARTAAFGHRGHPSPELGRARGAAPGLLLRLRDRLLAQRSSRQLLRNEAIRLVRRRQGSPRDARLGRSAGGVHGGHGDARNARNRSSAAARSMMATAAGSSRSRSGTSAYTVSAKPFASPRQASPTPSGQRNGLRHAQLVEGRSPP
jgi:hypothetical protein